jgi:hypothetical protein
LLNIKINSNKRCISTKKNFPQAFAKMSVDESLRKGKWTPDEENYANKIIYLFNQGLLPIPAGTTLRGYLSEKLHWYVLFHFSALISKRCSYCIVPSGPEPM